MTHVISEAELQLDFTAVYQEHFHEVLRWVRSLGGPSVDLEDITQEVFVVVHRRLGGFDGRNLRGWLFRICVLTVSDYRRRSWFKHLFQRRADVVLESIATEARGPSEELERIDNERRLHRILEMMSDSLRITFTLYEINGYRGEEIAELLQIPLKTVWTRLHRARKEFLMRVEKEERGR